MLNDILDVYIITYNRKDYLQNMLQSLVASKSPLKDVDIKVVDNNSNDGTAELLAKLSQQYPTIKHIKNNRNIGLAGNLCRAMELAGKKYFWILCDNDEIDFTAWSEIEKAMKQDYDLIMACTEYNCDYNTNKTAFALAQSTFTPSCIYKTKYLTEDVMTYAMADIPTILPHVCIACKIVNEKGKIFIPSQTVVKQLSNIVVRDIKNYSFDRTSTKDAKRLVHIRTKGLSFPVGILASFDSVKDINLRMEARRILMHQELCNGYGPFISPRDVFKNYFQGHNMPFYMLVEFIKKCPRKELLKGVCPIWIFKQDHGYYMHVLGMLKFKIWAKRKH